MAVKEKVLKPGQEMVKIYYFKGFGQGIGTRENINLNEYELVCNYPVWRDPGHSDQTILNVMFELFNWENGTFTPEDEEIGFHRPDTVYHTSMSVGDIVEVNGVKYVCDMAGWTKLGA